MAKIKKSIPYEFVLDELSNMALHTKPMFGCTGVYVGEKISLILRKKEEMDENTGIWVCIPDDHIAEVKKQYPFLTGVSFFNDPDSGWQVLHESHPEFEEVAMELCKRIRKNDPMIGRIPKPRKAKPKKAKPDPKKVSKKLRIKKTPAKKKSLAVKTDIKKINKKIKTKKRPVKKK